MGNAVNGSAGENQCGCNQENSMPPPHISELLHHCAPPAVRTAPAESTSTAAERSGINRGSWPSMENVAENLRSRDEKSPGVPIGSMDSSCPGRTKSL